MTIRNRFGGDWRTLQSGNKLPLAELHVRILLGFIGTGCACGPIVMRWNQLRMMNHHDYLFSLVRKWCQQLSCDLGMVGLHLSPGRPMFQHRIENCQQLPHAGGERHLLRLPRSLQALNEKMVSGTVSSRPCAALTS